MGVLAFRMSNDALAQEAAARIRVAGAQARVVPPHLGESGATLFVTTESDTSRPVMKLVRHVDPDAHRVLSA